MAKLLANCGNCGTPVPVTEIHHHDLELQPDTCVVNCPYCGKESTLALEQLYSWDSATTISPRAMISRFLQVEEHLDLILARIGGMESSLFHEIDSLKDQVTVLEDTIVNGPAEPTEENSISESEEVCNGECISCPDHKMVSIEGGVTTDCALPGSEESVFLDLREGRMVTIPFGSDLNSGCVTGPGLDIRHSNNAGSSDALFNPTMEEVLEGKEFNPDKA